LGLPRWLSGKESACQQEKWVQFLGREDPLLEEIATPVFLAWKFHEQRSLVGYSPWGHRRVGHD